MRARKRTHAAVAVIAATLLAGVWSYNVYFAPARTSLPTFIRVLAGPPAAVTLFTLDPATAYPTSATARTTMTLRGWSALGAAQISNKATARRLVASLDGRHSRPSDWPSCFEPRHGLTIRRGVAWAEMIICFECAQTYSTYGVGPFVLGSDHIIMSSRGNALYNMVARQESLPLAP